MTDVNLGFVGLGVMGRPMAGHLAAAGYRVTVYDLNRSAAEGLAAEQPQVRIADSVRDVAAASDIVFTMLPSGKEVRTIALGSESGGGNDGLIAGFRPGGLLVDTSSAEPWLTTDVAQRLRAAGVAMVDAPVSGAEAGARAAELVFMIGGADEDVARAAPLLDILGRRSFHLGPIGSGHAMKSINNLITAVTFMATGEGLVAGKRYGLDPAVMTEVLNLSTGMSWISQTHIAQRILSRRFDDPFKLELMLKDIEIATRVAEDEGIDMPLSNETRRLWREANASVPPGSSVSELIRTIETANDVEITPGR